MKWVLMSTLPSIFHIITLQELVVCTVLMTWTLLLVIMMVIFLLYGTISKCITRLIKELLQGFKSIKIIFLLPVLTVLLKQFTYKRLLFIKINSLPTFLSEAFMSQGKLQNQILRLWLQIAGLLLLMGGRWL